MLKRHLEDVDLINLFLLLSIFSTYVKPGESINFGESDPRWIGAWWLGPPCIGAVTLVFALIVALFPRRLPAIDNQMTDAVAKGVLFKPFVRKY
jgi:hypothetical protein